LSHLFAVDGEDEIILLYPHQLKVVDSSLMEVVVEQSYFKGSQYMIKAVFEKQFSLRMILN
jgi:hypothetical protein